VNSKVQIQSCMVRMLNGQKIAKVVYRLPDDSTFVIVDERRVWVGLEGSYFVEIA
jgi:hypothetical protein